MQSGGFGSWVEIEDPISYSYTFLFMMITEGLPRLEVPST